MPFVNTNAIDVSKERITKGTARVGQYILYTCKDQQWIGRITAIMKTSLNIEPFRYMVKDGRFVKDTSRPVETTTRNNLIYSREMYPVYVKQEDSDDSDSDSDYVPDSEDETESEYEEEEFIAEKLRNAKKASPVQQEKKEETEAESFEKELHHLRTVLADDTQWATIREKVQNRFKAENRPCNETQLESTRAVIQKRLKDVEETLRPQLKIRIPPHGPLDKQSPSMKRILSSLDIHEDFEEKEHEEHSSIVCSIEVSLVCLLCTLLLFTLGVYSMAKLV